MAGTGDAVVGQVDSPPTGNVHTFLIADVRGYTAFTVEHGDEAAASLTGRFADVVDEVVAAREGRVVELRGDEALVVFASARQALRAAVDLQQRLQQEMAANPTLPLRVGIGLDAGEAIPVRDGFRGAALNMAARLCSLAAAGEVLASDGVVHLARKVDGIAYTERGEMSLKGFADPVRVLEVSPAGDTGAFTAVASNVAAPGTVAPPEPGTQNLPIGGFLGALPSTLLVARTAELARLSSVVDAVAGGTGRLVLLSGEPGVGKTRLAQEVTLFARNRDFVIAAGRCYEAHQTLAFYPFVEALTAVYGAAPPSVQTEVSRRWTDLARLLPSVGLPVTETTSGQDQQRLLWAATGFIQAVAAQRPVALMVDDLHWADAASLELLQHLARHTRSDRVLLLGTFRDVEVNRQHPLESALRDLQREGLVERLDLRRLEQTGTAELMAASMGEQEISDEFAELVYRRTEGNPFFVQQVMRVLVERGDVFRRGNRWDRKSIAEIEVPESIRSVVGQRLSRLSEKAQEVLYESSVLGQAFGFDDLLAMSGRSEPDIEGALQEAARAGLIRENTGDAYSFDHALTQQSLYGELTTRRKRRLHLAAGEAIESLPARKRAGRAAEVAWHFLEADVPERALPWSLASGDDAIAVFAYRDAEMHFRTAGEIARELEETAAEAESLWKLGDALVQLARYDEAIATFEAAESLYATLHDAEGEMRVVSRIGRVHSERMTRQVGIARLVPVLARAPATASPALIELQIELARLYFLEDVLDEALPLAERATATARELGDDRLLAQAQVRRASILTQLLRSDEALDGFLEAIDLAESTGDLYTLHIALNNIGIVYTMQGRMAEVDAAAERQLEVARMVGAPGDLAWVLLQKGNQARARGDLPAALAALQEAADICRTIGPNRSSYAIPNAATVRLLMGDETALIDLEECAASDISQRFGAAASLAMWDLLHDRPEKALSHVQGLSQHPSVEAQSRFVVDRFIGRALVQLGDIERADTIATAALVEASKQGILPVLNTWTRVVMEVRVAQGQIAEARTLLEQSLAMAREAGVRFEAAQVLFEYGWALARAGEDSLARQPLEEALEEFRAMNVVPFIKKAEELLEGLERS